MVKESILEFLNKINHEIEQFIKASIESSVSSYEWGALLGEFETPRCWKLKNCTKRQCPSFGNEDYRCWLLAGTLCNGEVQGEFASKYQSCLECDVFKVIHDEPLRSIYANVDILIYHLQSRARKFREISIKDQLTGLYNRHYFNEVIDRETARSERRLESIAFIMIDLDRFKQINDTFGHLMGDKLLVEAAQIIQNSVRKSDLVFRYGGDEYLVLLNNAGIEQSMLTVRRISCAVNAWNQNHANGMGCHISLSMGYAICDHDTDFRSALKQADENMYLNKKQRKPSGSAIDHE